MAEWRWYAVTLTTGAILGDLPLSAFKGERSLVGGKMSADLPLAGFDVDTRRQLLDWTTPGRVSIIAERDDALVGEWAVWKRSRSNDGTPIKLEGAEIVSVLNRRVMWAWAWSQVEQLTIARDLLVEGFAGAGTTGRPGAVAVTVPAITPSGQLRDRNYKTLDGDVGQRLAELSAVESGFDYLINTTRVGNTVTRTALFYYPRAGVELPYVFEMGGPGTPPGNVLSLSLDEDGTRLASNALAVGSTTNDVTTTGDYQDLALVTAGYPFYETTASYSTVTEQSTIDKHARALWDDAQTAELPIKVTALADKVPAFGDYDLGDSLVVSVEPSANYPDGWQGQIRIIGWTLSPANGPEIVELAVTKEPT